VNIGDRIFFDTDSSSIRADAQATLGRQAQWLNKYRQYAIVIEGHADERGTREYNLALGARRAAATRDFLTSKGVAAQRMKTISYGKERPVAVCDDISCWSQNRRAVTTLNGAGS
ncbi:MAG: peptidoglycan-associated lipoprotein Pal, partial [Mesorhizobium sp.]|nr:peptidoglycan-associated lipoprotein Pal [Mesorhizobium sp.]